MQRQASCVGGSVSMVWRKAERTPHPNLRKNEKWPEKHYPNRRPDQLQSRDILSASSTCHVTCANLCLPKCCQTVSFSCDLWLPKCHWSFYSKLDRFEVFWTSECFESIFGLPEPWNQSQTLQKPWKIDLLDRILAFPCVFLYTFVKKIFIFR